MIIKSNGLPGATLAAWAIFDPNTGTISKQSGNITSISAQTSGANTFVFQAGTFATVDYTVAVLQCEFGYYHSIDTKTLTGCKINNWVGSTSSNYGTGQKMGVYFYAV